MYSFGIILWEICSRQTPFENLPPGTIATRVVQGQRPPVDTAWDKQVQQVIKFSWDHDRLSRVDTKTARRLLEEINIGDPDAIGIRPRQANNHRGYAANENNSSTSSSGVTFVFLDVENSGTVRPTLEICGFTNYFFL